MPPETAPRTEPDPVPDTAAWPTVACGLSRCRNRLRMRTIGSDENGDGGRPDYDGIMGKGNQFCSRKHRDKAERGDSVQHIYWTRHPDRRWGISRTIDGPGIVLFLGRRGLALTWGEWS